MHEVTTDRQIGSERCPCGAKDFVPLPLEEIQVDKEEGEDCRSAEHEDATEDARETPNAVEILCLTQDACVRTFSHNKMADFFFKLLLLLAPS